MARKESYLLRSPTQFRNIRKHLFSFLVFLFTVLSLFVVFDFQICSVQSIQRCERTENKWLIDTRWTHVNHKKWTSNWVKLKEQQTPRKWFCVFGFAWCSSVMLMNGFFVYLLIVYIRSLYFFSLFLELENSPFFLLFIIHVGDCM